MANQTTVPVACTLTADEAEHQLASWESLGESLLRSELHDAGAALWFDEAAESSVRVVAEREATCCGFLALDVSRETGRIRLDITTNNPDGVPVIHLLAHQVTGETE